MTTAAVVREVERAHPTEPGLKAQPVRAGFHCTSVSQVRRVLVALHERMAGVGPELHPDKTEIVYCEDSNRRGSFEQVSFTFLGYTFRPRSARWKDGVVFTAFFPAVSRDALKKVSAVVRSWRLRQRVNSTEADLARMVNPIVRAWMAYYGAFYRTELEPVFD